MIYMCNYPAVEFETEARSVVVNNSDRCVFVCACYMYDTDCVIKVLQSHSSANQSFQERLN